MMENIFSKPPAYGIISNWLGPEMVQRLLDFAQAQRDSFIPSGVGYDEYARIDANIRRSSRTTKLGDLKNELRWRVRTALPAMFKRLGTDAFEPSRLEVEMVAHGDGAFFTEHCDTVVDGRKLAISRIISQRGLLLSLAAEIVFGRVLRIYPLTGREKSDAFVEVEPLNDTLVFFPSWFPHEILPVICPTGQFEDSRFAINCWVYQ